MLRPRWLRKIKVWKGQTPGQICTSEQVGTATCPQPIPARSTPENPSIIVTITWTWSTTIGWTTCGSISRRRGSRRRRASNRYSHSFRWDQIRTTTDRAAIRIRNRTIKGTSRRMHPKRYQDCSSWAGTSSATWASLRIRVGRRMIARGVIRRGQELPSVTRQMIDMIKHIKDIKVWI